MIYLFVFMYLLAGITIVKLTGGIYEMSGIELKPSIRICVAIIWPLAALHMFATG
jgi:hypothetical protein